MRFNHILSAAALSLMLLLSSCGGNRTKALQCRTQGNDRYKKRKDRI